MAGFKLSFFCSLGSRWGLPVQNCPKFQSGPVASETKLLCLQGLAQNEDIPWGVISSLESCSPPAQPCGQQGWLGGVRGVIKTLGWVGSTGLVLLDPKSQSLSNIAHIQGKERPDTVIINISILDLCGIFVWPSETFVLSWFVNEWCLTLYPGL